MLWDKDDWLCDKQLDEVLPYQIYLWCNRHLYPPPSEYEPDDGTAGEKDKHHKRCFITGMMVDMIAKAYCGCDDKVRSHNHWGRMRVDFKASRCTPARLITP